MSQTLEIPSVDDFLGLKEAIIERANRKIAEFHMNPDNFRGDYAAGALKIEFTIISGPVPISKYGI